MSLLPYGLLVLTTKVLSLSMGSAAIERKLGHGRVAIDRCSGRKICYIKLARQLVSSPLGTMQTLLTSIRLLGQSSSPRI